MQRVLRRSIDVLGVVRYCLETRVSRDWATPLVGVSSA